MLRLIIISLLGLTLLAPMVNVRWRIPSNYAYLAPDRVIQLLGAYANHLLHRPDPEY